MARSRWTMADLFEGFAPPGGGLVPALAGGGVAAPGVDRSDGRWHRSVVVAAAVAILVGVLAVPFTQHLPSLVHPDAGAPRAASTDLPAGLDAAIAAATAPAIYHLTETADGWAAANPARGFSAAFSPQAVDVTAASGGAALGLEVARLGRGDDLARVPAADLEADGARIEYRRGAVTEWYVNDQRGLEQGVTLAHAPAGDAIDPVVVELAPSRGYQPQLSDTGDSVTFVGEGTSFTYRGLSAVDADGQALAAELGVADGRVTLSVDDAGATYPITIDPIVATQEAELAYGHAGGAGDNNGAAVAVWGDWAVVGAPGVSFPEASHSGVVALFYRDSSGLWHGGGGLPTPLADDVRAGTAVAISGHTPGVPDTIAVGMPDVGDGAGLVWVFVPQVPGSALSPWTLQQTYSGTTSDDRFGTSVALSGDTLVVGSPHDRAANQDQTGAAYAYQRTGTTWSAGTRITHSAPEEHDNFGRSVAIDGGTIVVGSPDDANGTDPDGPGPLRAPVGGSVSVFSWNGTSAVSQADHLTPSDGVEGDLFGTSVAVSGDRVVVGADQGIHGPGKAYVLHRTGVTWAQEDILEPVGPGDAFGATVAISGDLALIGDPGAGTTHVFTRVGSDWVDAAQLTSTGATAVALSGGTAVIGSKDETHDGEPGYGLARALRLQAGNPSASIHAEGAATRQFEAYWDVAFSVPVSGFSAGDLLVDGTTSGTVELVDDGDGDASTYRVHVYDVLQDGTVRIRIPAGAATDATGLSNDASSSTDNVTTFDRITPSATVALAAGQTSPSSASTLRFTVTASEPLVTGADGTIPVIVSSTTGALTTVVTPHTPGDQQHFDVAITGMAQSGPVAVRVAGSTLVDPAGNRSTSDSNTATVQWVDDNTAPEVILTGGNTTEGVALQLTGVHDAEGDAAVTWTATQTSGDAGATCTFSDPHAASPTITCDDDGSWTLQATADDGANPVATDSAPLTVFNAAPQLGTLTSPGSVAPGQVFTLSTTATDLGTHDVLSCTVDWGDSQTTPGTISAGLCSAQHSYSSAGNRLVRMHVADDDGGTGSSNEIQVQVAQGTQTVAFPAPATPVTYGVAPFTVSASATSGLAVTFGAAGSCTIAGTTVTITGGGSCDITASQPGNQQYQAAEPVVHRVVVDRAPLTITAPDATMAYGALPPALTPSITGFVNGDDASDLTFDPVSCRLDTFSHFDVGVHPGGITCEGGFSPSYVPSSFVDGTLTVTKAALTVTAPDSTMVYGDNSVRPDPQYSGFQYGDQPSGLDQAPSCIGGDFRTEAGSYPGGVTCSDGVAHDYDITYVAGDLTVTKAPLDVKAPNTTTSYGTVTTPLPIYTGFKNGDGPAHLTTPATCTSGPSTAAVGSHPGSVTCSGGSDADYELTYRNGDLTVTKATLTVTAPDATMVYGDPVPSVTPTYSGFRNGEHPSDLTAAPVCSGGSPTTAAGVHADALTCSGGAASNYAFTYVAGDLTVTKAPLTVTAGDSGQAYGSTSTPVVSATYSGFRNGQNESVVQPRATCTSIASPTLAVGVYPHGTSCSGGASANYELQYVDGTFTVRQAVLSVTASSTSMAYGSNPPAVAPIYSGFVNGDDASDIDVPPTCHGLAGLNVGTSTAGNTCSGGSDDTYTFQLHPGTLTVTKAPLTITAPNASMAYGSVGVQVEPQYSGFVNGDDADDVTAPLCLGGDPSLLPGVHAGAITCRDGEASNYDLTYVAGDLTVAPAVVTITPFDATTTYGTPAVVSASYEGIIAGDTVADIVSTPPTCTSSRDVHTAVGTYADATSCSGAVVADPGRYSIRYAPGDLTVTKAPLTITASDATMHFGDAGAVVTPGYGGFVNGETAAVLTDAPTCGGGSPTTAPGVHPGGTTCTGARAGNYAISYVAGTLTVDKAPLTITASDAMMTYGGDAPTVTPHYDGFLDGDDASVLLAQPTCSGGSSSTPAGTYPGATTCSGAQSTDRYEITYEPGTLTVAKAPLTITASDGSMTYGGTPPAITASIDGFVNGEGASVLTAVPTCSGGSINTPAGHYADATSCSGAAAANYAFDYINGDLTVTKAPLTITASAGSMAYGASGATVTPTYAGFVNGQTAAVLSTAPTCGGGTPTTPVGSHPGATSCSGAAAHDYEISYVTGDLTVTKAPLTITASAGHLTYGGAAPVVTPSYAGFVNGETAAVLTTQPTCGGGSPTTPAGTHAGGTTCSGAAAANYEITYVGGTLTVDQAPLTVTADAKTKGYGDAVPPLTATLTGFVNGEGPAVVSGAPVLSTTANASSNVGTYPITVAVGTLSAANYRFTTVDGVLTVTKASATLVANPALLRIIPLQLYVGTVSGKLTFGPAGAPVAGQTVTFSAGTTPICTATTAADGTASCNVALPGALAAIANLGYTATFAGNGNLAATTAKGPLLSIS